MERCHAQTPHDNQYQILKMSPQSSKPKTKFGRNWNILLVEDNKINQIVITKWLERCGCKISIANDGQKALDFIEKSKIFTGMAETGKDLDVVLMDWQMPVMGGNAATRRIRELEAQGVILKHVPIIGMSAQDILETFWPSSKKSDIRQDRIEKSEAGSC